MRQRAQRSRQAMPLVPPAARSRLAPFPLPHTQWNHSTSPHWTRRLDGGQTRPLETRLPLPTTCSLYVCSHPQTGPCSKKGLSGRNSDSVTQSRTDRRSVTLQARLDPIPLGGHHAVPFCTSLPPMALLQPPCIPQNITIMAQSVACSVKDQVCLSLFALNRVPSRVAAF